MTTLVKDNDGKIVGHIHEGGCSTSVVARRYVKDVRGCRLQWCLLLPVTAVMGWLGGRTHIRPRQADCGAFDGSPALPVSRSWIKKLRLVGWAGSKAAGRRRAKTPA